jgi:hypothetical protein
MVALRTDGLNLGKSFGMPFPLFCRSVIVQAESFRFRLNGLCEALQLRAVLPFVGQLLVNGITAEVETVPGLYRFADATRPVEILLNVRPAVLLNAARSGNWPSARALDHWR